MAFRPDFGVRERASGLEAMSLEEADPNPSLSKHLKPDPDQGPRRWDSCRCIEGGLAPGERRIQIAGRRLDELHGDEEVRAALKSCFSQGSSILSLCGTPLQL